MKFWLEGRPTKINKEIIGKVIGYPTLDQPKSIRSGTKMKWNGNGMSMDNIEEPLIYFFVYAIAHKFYQSSILNNMLCITVDLGYKIVKKYNSYDLVEL